MERLPYELCLPTWEALKWKPAGPEQEEPLKNRDRFPCIVGGERGGKSTVSTKIATPHIIALPLLRYDKYFHTSGPKKGKLRYDPKTDRPMNPDFCIFGPTYKEARIEFEYIEEDLRKLGKLQSVSKPKEGAWQMISTDGVVGQTFSLEYPEAVRAMTLEFALVVEAGGVHYSAIERIRGRVTTTRGFIIYSGTIEASQQWWKDWLVEGKRPNLKNIKSYEIPSWANLFEFPGGREDPEILAWYDFLGHDLFMERCAAVAVPLKSRVLKDVHDRHVQVIKKVPGDAHFEIWVDPGFATAYAVVFVAWWYVADPDNEGKTKKFFYFYNELYEQGLVTEPIIDLVKQDPHFGRITDGVIDIGAKGNRDATQSALEVWEHHTSIEWHYSLWREDRLRERLNHSALHDDFAIHPRCKGLLAEAGLGEPVFAEMHPWKFYTDRDGRVTSEKPIDAWNHSWKAVGYGLLKHLGQVSKSFKVRTRKRIGNKRKKQTPRDRRW